MIRIQQLKLPVTHTQEELEQKIRKTLKIGKHDLQEIELLRRSIDARKKSELMRTPYCGRRKITRS